MARSENGGVEKGRGVAVVGGDKRQYYLSLELAERGYSVFTCAVPPRAADNDVFADVGAKIITGSGVTCSDRSFLTDEYDQITENNCGNETNVVDISEVVTENAAIGDHKAVRNESNGETPQIPCDNGVKADVRTAKHGRRAGVTVCGELRDAIGRCRDIILPFPLSPDGITLNCTEEEKPSLRNIFLAISEVCGSSARVYAGAVKERSREIAASFGIDIVDYGAMEEIALENAVPTAEGAVMTAMETLNVTVRGSRFTVIGYGRCGSELARLLRAMGAEVCGIARSGRDRARMRNDGVTPLDFGSLVDAINGSDVTFNTVPFNVIDCNALSMIGTGRLVIELASAPGGVDRECAARYGVRVIHAPSLPGKYAPKTAAEIISRALIPLLNR